MKFSHKMPLFFFYTMVQKSQKWPKTQINGGPALKDVASQGCHKCSCMHSALPVHTVGDPVHLPFFWHLLIRAPLNLYPARHVKRLIDPDNVPPLDIVPFNGAYKAGHSAADMMRPGLHTFILLSWNLSINQQELICCLHISTENTSFKNIIK